MNHINCVPTAARGVEVVSAPRAIPQESVKVVHGNDGELVQTAIAEVSDVIRCLIRRLKRLRMS